jgi:hypothetical protein
MADLSKLSDEELDQLIQAKKSKPRDVAQLSDEELDKLIAQKQGASESSGPDLGALKVGAETGLTFGARPFIAGVAGGLGYGIDQLRQGKSGVEGFRTGFSEARKEAQDEQAQLSQASPGSFLAGELGGSLLLPGAALKAVTRGAKGVDAAARIGVAMGTGRALGQADDASSALQDMAAGGAAGVAGEKVLQTGGAVGRYLAKKLESASAGNALKATGAMLKDVRALEGKGRTEKFGRELVGRGLVRAGDTLESVGKKANMLKEDAGKALESIYSYARNAFGAEDLPGFNPYTQKQDILNAASEKLGDSVDGKAALRKLSDYMDDLVLKYGDRGLDPRKANDIKGALDEVINYSRNPLNKQPDVEKAFHAAREFVSKRIDDGIDAIGAKTGRTDLLKDLKEANAAYGTGKQAGGMARDKLNREQANNALGLRQSILAGGGGAAGAVYGLASGGEPEDVLASAAGGAALGASLKTIERYGPAITAHAEKVLADKIRSSSVIRRMVEKSPQAYQTLLAGIANQLTSSGAPSGPAPVQRLSGETP